VRAKEALRKSSFLKAHGFTGCGKTRISGGIGVKRSSVAKAIVDSVGFIRGLKPPPPSGLSFSAACLAVPYILQNECGL
jgi:hypothetical protein